MQELDSFLLISSKINYTIQIEFSCQQNAKLNNRIVTNEFVKIKETPLELDQLTSNKDIPGKLRSFVSCLCLNHSLKFFGSHSAVHSQQRFQHATDEPAKKNCSFYLNDLERREKITISTLLSEYKCLLKRLLYFFLYSFLSPFFIKTCI